MTLEDERRKARVRLHQTLARPFRFYRDSTKQFTEVSARLDRRAETVGNVAGGGIGLAQFQDVRPKLIFLRSEHQPRRGDIYILLVDDEPSPADVYEAEVLEPPDGVTVTALCTLSGWTKAEAYF